MTILHFSSDNRIEFQGAFDEHLIVDTCGKVFRDGVPLDGGTHDGQIRSKSSWIEGAKKDDSNCPNPCRCGISRYVLLPPTKRGPWTRELSWKARSWEFTVRWKVSDGSSIVASIRITETLYDGETKSCFECNLVIGGIVIENELVPKYSGKPFTKKDWDRAVKPASRAQRRLGKALAQNAEG